VRLRTIALAVAALFVSAVPSPAFAQTADNVVVVINDASPASVQIGEYYARKRAIAQDHIVRIKTATTDTIPRADYIKTIDQPIAQLLTKQRLLDRTLYIVLTKGVPLRIDGTIGGDGTTASVDSELTLLYRRLVGTPVAIAGHVPNPYYLNQKKISDAKFFSRASFDIYLVTRLDGFTVDDVLKLIDRGSTPSTDGKIVLDQRGSLIDAGGDQWLAATADRLRQSGAGDRVVLEMTKALAVTDGPVLGYFSWGSNDPANRLRRFGFQFVPGAIAGLFVSTDGRTFTEPPADWVPGVATDKRGYGTQSLTGDLIRDGITGVAGHVTEPYLDATIRPQILFPAYLAGFNLAESFYLAMPYLSWQTVVVGDPLCAPFPRTPVAPDQIDKGIDPDTTLPAYYSDRRIAFLSQTGVNPLAIKHAVRGEFADDAGNHEDAERDYTEAFQLEPRLSEIGIRLATLYSTRGDNAKAIETYRRVLSVAPGNIVAMNNLAYALAEFQHDPTDALPLAERAYAGSRNSPIVADTLGWIHHLLGDDHLAAPLVEQALQVTDVADIQLHAAFVHAGLGDPARARTELDAAIKLDPTFADRADVKALRDRIKSK
jgi:uncharacterized protein (TIGR03790 family)